MKSLFVRLAPRRLAWLNLPTVSLLTLLQRAPVQQVVETAENLAVRSPLGVVLKSAAALAASLGAVHSLAGATTLTATTASPLNATSGTAIPNVALGVKGTQTPAASFTVSGQIPPGLTLAGSGASVTSASALPVVLNGSALTLSGTPTTAGTYNIGLVVWEFANGTGLSTPKFTYQVIVTGGSGGGGGGTATKPAITTQPKTQTVAAGKALTLTVVATGSPAPTFQWKKGTTALTGQTSASLKFTAIKTTDAGSYTCVVKNSAGSVTTTAAVVTVKATPGAPTSLAGHASSKTSITLSWKAPASTAATAPTAYKLERASDTLFSKGKKTITLGAVTSYVDTTLTAATTYYYRVSAATIAGTSKASAVLKVATLKATATGTARMTELMARVYCGTGSSIATGGFVVGAGAPKPVLIRAVGPTLSTLGVASSALLKDPVIELHDASGGLIGSNDNWQDNGNASAITSAITKVKATPFATTDTASAALLVTLPPGAYTFSVNGAASGKGIVLIEVYDTQ